MNWRQGFSALAIRATTLFGVGLLLYAAGRLALDYVPRFGMAPCETSDSLYHISNGVEAILLVAGLLSQIRVWRCPSLQMLIAAISAPVLALLVQYAAVDHETSLFAFLSRAKRLPGGMVRDGTHHNVSGNARQSSCTQRPMLNSVPLFRACIARNSSPLICAHGWCPRLCGARTSGLSFSRSNGMSSAVPPTPEPGTVVEYAVAVGQRGPWRQTRLGRMTTRP